MRRLQLDRCVSVQGLALATTATMRCMSQANVPGVRPAKAWPSPGQSPRQPRIRNGHPSLPLRKNAVEWRFHHGHGGRYYIRGPLREISDFEYADGTPAPISNARYGFKHFQDSLLVQLIRSGALVERCASMNYLPRIPGVAEQRDWDPEIPLFLEDVDEHGKAPAEHFARTVDEKHIQSKFATKSVSATLVNEHNKETLEPITMFASYDPAAFITEKIKLKETTRPLWSRRRWVLSNQFLVPKSPLPKNTIKDE